MTFLDIKNSICKAQCGETFDARMTRHGANECRGCLMFEKSYDELKQMRLRDLYAISKDKTKKGKSNVVAKKVIKCKDCKWFNDGGWPCRNDFGMADPRENDYCSCAVRR